MAVDGWTAHLAVAVAGYLIGGFPTGVVLSRFRYRIDVREMGSGNIGATNVTRSFGWFAGTLTLTADFLKGFLPLLFLKGRFPLEPWLWVTGALALVTGHCFSPYLRLRGGKGVATSLGCVSAVVPWLGVACGVAYAVALGVTRISAVGSLTGVLVALLYCALWSAPPPLVALLLGLCALVLSRHHANIRRLWGEWRDGSSHRNPT